MTKADIIAKIAENAEISKKAAGAAFDTVIAELTASMARGEKTTIIGFGTFEAKKRSARSARNPRTGETIKIKAHSVPAFRAGKKLKDAVLEGTKKKSGRKKKAEQ